MLGGATLRNATLCWDLTDFKIDLVYWQIINYVGCAMLGPESAYIFLCTLLNMYPGESRGLYAQTDRTYEANIGYLASSGAMRADWQRLYHDTNIKFVESGLLDHGLLINMEATRVALNVPMRDIHEAFYGPDLAATHAETSAVSLHQLGLFFLFILGLHGCNIVVVLMIEKLAQNKSTNRTVKESGQVLNRNRFLMTQHTHSVPLTPHRYRLRKAFSYY